MFKSDKKSPLLSKDSTFKNALNVFLIAAITATCFFLPFLLMRRGYFLFYGDFNVQQIPFYSLAHSSIREGNIFWSWNTDLGANFISSYSFYLLGSPFFWLTLPFPNWMVPLLIGPLYIIKFSTAAVTAYLFMRYFVKSHDAAMIGALLYAFSSFQAYNIFFNHFHDVTALFPLLLIGIEEYMQKQRRGVLLFAVAINALVNYFFFVGEVVFVAMYWFYRLASGSWELTPKKFFWLAFECIAGLAITAFILLPSVITIMQNPRSDRFITGYSFLVYGWEQRYPAIIRAFFFPPEAPAFPNFFPNSEAKWSSLEGWLPLFSMTGVFAFCQAKKGHWARRIIFTCILFAFIPGLNAMFYAFNEAYYARWFYMLILIMGLATAMALEDQTVNWPRAIKWTAGITAGIFLPLALLPKKIPENIKDLELGLFDDPLRFWPSVIIASASLIILSFILWQRKRLKNRFYPLLLASVIFITIVYSTYFIGLGKTYSYNDDWIIDNGIKGRQNISIPDIENVRIDVMSGPGNDGMDNQAMFWKIPTIQAFHSVVPRSIMDFYPAVGVQRGVASRPEFHLHALRSLLSVKYLFDDRRTASIDYPGYVEYGIQNGFKIWENTNYIPFGFTYDGYIDQETFDKTYQSSKDHMLLKAILLSDEQIEKYSDIISERLDYRLYDYSVEQLAKDCAERRKHTVENFYRDNRGFGGNINLPAPNLVFFSVPYEEGWSATVNGKPVEVEKVNVGFMAIRCEAGENEIRFNYMTPGLIKGVIISISALAISIAYILYFRQKNKKTAQGINKADNPNDNNQKDQDFVSTFLQMY